MVAEVVGIHVLVEIVDGIEHRGYVEQEQSASVPAARAPRRTTGSYAVPVPEIIDAVVQEEDKVETDGGPEGKTPAIGADDSTEPLLAPAGTSRYERSEPTYGKPALRSSVRRGRLCRRRFQGWTAGFDSPYRRMTSSMRLCHRWYPTCAMSLSYRGARAP